MSSFYPQTISSDGGAAGQATPRRTTGEGPEAPLIAVIDDNVELLELLDAVLTDAGYRTLPLITAREAHGVLPWARPHLVVLDLWLEAPDAGENLLRELEADPATRAIPVIVCSGHLAVLPAKVAALQQRGYTVLTKPFGLDALLNLIRTLIDSPPTA